MARKPKKRPDRAANRRLRLEYEERQAEARKAYAARHRPPPPSDVVITAADGSVRVEPALTEQQLREIVKDRPTISQSRRLRILRRDGWSCRYCGGGGPFQIDHVTPVAHGGSTTDHNLVTACEKCNQRKGVQRWQPMPLR